MSEEFQNLSQFAKVKAESLREKYPKMPQVEIVKIANRAAEQAEEEIGRAMEAGNDLWATREQVLHDLTNS